MRDFGEGALMSAMNRKRWPKPARSLVTLAGFARKNVIELEPKRPIGFWPMSDRILDREWQ
jgi:hypothetical protein